MSGTCTYHNGDWHLRTAVVDGRRWLLATDVIRGLGVYQGGNDFRSLGVGEVTRLPKGLIRVKGVRCPRALSGKGLRRFADTFRSFHKDDALEFLAWAQGIADGGEGVTEVHQEEAIEASSEEPALSPVKSLIALLTRAREELSGRVEDAEEKMDRLCGERDAVQDALDALEALEGL